MLSEEERDLDAVSQNWKVSEEPDIFTAQAEKNNAKTRQTDSQTESIRYGAYFILSVLEEGDIKMNSGFY